MKAPTVNAMPQQAEVNTANNGAGSNGSIIILANAPSFPISAAALDERRAKCLAMRVMGVADVEGFKVADRARMDVKADRCAVQNRQKELRKQIKDWQEECVDKPADHLCDELKKIETYLESQTEPVKLEKERLAKEAKEKKEREAAEKLANRVAALVACRAVKNPIEIEKLSDAAFDDLLSYCQRENEIREEQEAAEQQKRDAERAELEELRKLRTASHVDPLPPPTNMVPSRPTTAIPLPTPVIAPPRYVDHSPENDDPLASLEALKRFADSLDSIHLPDCPSRFKELRALCVAVVSDAATEIRRLVDCEAAKITLADKRNVSVSEAGAIDIDDV